MAKGALAAGVSLFAAACSPADSRSLPEIELRAGSTGGDARALRLDEDGPFIDHEMSQAQSGDVLIANPLVRFYVRGPAQGAGYVPYAGWIIDAALSDGLSEPAYDGVDGFYPLVNLSPVAADDVVIERDGTDGGPAVVSVTGSIVAVPEILNVQGAPSRPFDARVRVEYSLGPGDVGLVIHTRVENLSAAAQPVDIGDVILFGDDEAEPFAAPPGFDRYAEATSLEVLGSSHDTRPASYAVYAPDTSLTLLSGSSFGDQVGGDGTLVGYTVAAGSLEPGQVLEGVRVLAVAPDIDGALAPYWDGLSAPTTRLTGDVREGVAGFRGVAGARVSVFRDLELRQWVTQAISDEDGGFDLAAPPGRYYLLATGRTSGAWLPSPGAARQLAEGRSPSAAREVTLSAGLDAFVELELGLPAHLRLDVRDEAGAPSAAKVIFEAEDARAEACFACGERTPQRDPSVRQVVWTPEGSAELELEAGSYTVTASRGPDAELDVRRGVVLPAGETTELSLTIRQSVQHPGYVAMDPHVHGVYSQHGEATGVDRVVTAIAEGLDVHVSTDHDVITDYSPALRQLGLEQALLSISGAELETANGDHCAWPLAFDPRQPLGGARRWWLDGDSVADAYRHYADRGAIVIHVAHGASHFRNAGYDLGTGQVSRPDRFSFGFNAMEVHNGGGNGGRSALVPIWMSLINFGHRVAPLGASDSHSRLQEVGVARTYVRLGQRELSAVAVAEATVGLHTVASTGPFIELSTATGSGPGDTEPLPADGDIELHISVHAPSWMPVDEVHLWENGVEIARWEGTTEPAVGLDASRAVWFEHHYRVQPDRDRWYAVETTGGVNLAPVYPGSRPWALTAPLFVDADGDGELRFD